MACPHCKRLAVIYADLVKKKMVLFAEYNAAVFAQDIDKLESEL